MVRELDNDWVPFEFTKVHESQVVYGVPLGSLLKQLASSVFACDISLEAGGEGPEFLQRMKKSQFRLYGMQGLVKVITDGMPPNELEKIFDAVIGGLPSYIYGETSPQLSGRLTVKRSILTNLDPSIVRRVREEVGASSKIFFT